MKLHVQRWAGRPSRLWGPLFSGLFVLAGLAIATPAEAQLLPYDITRTPITYQALPLSNGGPVTAIPISGDYSLGTVTLPFSFQFFGQSYSSINVTVNGWASINAQWDSHSNWTGAIPTNSEPNGLFAVWWGDESCNSGEVKSQVLGTAPNRTFVIEWNCQYWTQSTPSIHSQLWLQEDSSTIEMRYGQSTDSSIWAATVGIEDPTGNFGYAGLPCAASCSPSAWPTNTSIVYSQAADLSVEQVVVDPILYSGVPFPAHVDVRNRGGQDALGFGLDFFLSTDAVLSPDDVRIGAAPGTQDAVKGATVGFDATLTIPADTYEGTYYVLAKVDPAGVVVETNRNNNVGSSMAAVSPPKADLVVAGMEVPTEPFSNRMLEFTWTARNMGNLLAPEVAYTIVLSKNDVITSTDIAVGSGTLTIPAFTDLERVEQVALPAELGEGPYYVGILLDPLMQLVEIDDMNNITSSTDAIWVVSDNLEILTAAELPVGGTGSTYCVALQASGGTGLYSWTIDSGVLPEGIQMVTEGIEGDQTTLLCGTAMQAGTFPFHAMVMSGGLTADRDFTLEIDENFTPLVIATSDIPGAHFQIPYHAMLQATGGNAPYEWNVVEGALPRGVSLSHGGVIDGTPAVDGTYTFTVEAKDAGGHVALRQLELVVSSPNGLTCMTDLLPAMMVGDEVSAKLQAGGGTGSYTWSTLNYHRLPAGNDQGETDNADPPGFLLAQDGVVTGTAAVAGRYQWQVNVTDQSGTTDTCTVLMEIGYETGPSIETMQLADALVGVPYRARITASGTQGAVTWAMAPGSVLPEGFTLDGTTGDIAGLANADLLEGAEVRTFPFAVEARDEANKATTQALSITVYREARTATPVEPTGGKDKGGGCQSGDGAPALATLGIALAALLRKRRS